MTFRSSQSKHSYAPCLVLVLIKTSLPRVVSKASSLLLSVNGEHDFVEFSRCQESFNGKQIHHISILLKLEWLFWSVNIRQACSLKHERCQMFNAKRELKMNKQAQPSPETQMKMNWKLVVKGHKRY